MLEPVTNKETTCAAICVSFKRKQCSNLFGLVGELFLKKKVDGDLFVKNKNKKPTCWRLFVTCAAN